MVPIGLRDEWARPVELLAQEQGAEVARFVNEWVERQLALARERRIHDQSARFRAQYNILRAAYPSAYGAPAPWAYLALLPA
jgi:hypothetical protein